jgi:nucleoside transporter
VCRLKDFYLLCASQLFTLNLCYMNSAIRTQLSIMMFLEYMIWGAWFVAMGTYLGEQFKAEGGQIGLAYGNAWFGALVSPFFIGMIADRYFPAQKVLGVLHLIGAALLYWIAQIDNWAQFPWVLLVYSCVYMPTVALTNTVAMGQTTDPGKDFPTLRVLGTIGWIVAGFVINDYMKTNIIFIVPAAISALLGIYSFFLPNTPPKGDKSATSFGQILGLDALSLFKNRSYLIFFIGSILLCIPLSFYYSFTAGYLDASKVANVPSKMALLGQGSEVVFMLLMPFFLQRMGVRNILLAAMAAWIIRYLCFSFGGEHAHMLLLLGVFLHGICYDFFFVTGYIYTEQTAGERYKNSAQGLFTIATYGMGMTLGSYIGGWVADMYKHNEVMNWSGFWMVPVYIAAAILVTFLVAFKEPKPAAS